MLPQCAFDVERCRTMQRDKVYDFLDQSPHDVHVIKTCPVHMLMHNLKSKLARRGYLPSGLLITVSEESKSSLTFSSNRETAQTTPLQAAITVTRR